MKPNIAEDLTPYISSVVFGGGGRLFLGEAEKPSAGFQYYSFRLTP